MTTKELINQWFSNIDSKNFEGLGALMASNHRFHNPMAPQPMGKEEHLGMMQMMTAALEGTHHVDVVVEENGWVAVRGHWSGKHTGEFQGVPATGNAVQFTWMDFFHLVDGKVADEYLENEPNGHHGSNSTS